MLYVYLSDREQIWKKDKNGERVSFWGFDSLSWVLLSSLYGGLLNCDPILILVISVSFRGDEPKVQ
jgi:hypothetical protein